MRARIVLLISVALLAVFLFIGATAHVQVRRTVWEYKVVENSWDEKQMSTLGAEGWELVAVDAGRGDRVRAFSNGLKTNTTLIPIDANSSLSGLSYRVKESSISYSELVVTSQLTRRILWQRPRNFRS